MEERTREKVFHVFTLSILALIAIIGGATAYPQWRRSRSLQAQQAQVRDQIETVKKEISQLTENQRRFRVDPDFVETVARRNRRVYPGELVFIFDD